MPARQRRQQRAEGHGLVDDLDAQAIADVLAHLNIEADVFFRIGRVNDPVARRLRVNGADKGLASQTRVAAPVWGLPKRAVYARKPEWRRNANVLRIVVRKARGIA